MPISRRTGVDIYYEKTGSGPPLVLIHAIPFDHRMWIYQAATFSAHFTCIAMDIRALGQSGKPDQPCSLRDMADDIMGVLTEEGVSSDAIVMGCSIGSKLAMLLACDHPDVFKACIAVGGTSEKQGNFDHRINAYLEHQKNDTLGEYHLGHLRHGVTKEWAETPIGRYLIDGFARRGKTIDSRALVHLFRVLQESDITGKLPACKVPILIVNGEHDSARSGGARTHELFPHIAQKILPGTGHCCMLEDPAGFDRLVIDFIETNGLMKGNAQ
ncbi:MAG: hypothetical protein RLZ98_3511 [Pseudomonadota bacterium]|jgi:pimeloyl-ACP methyl ester carboxylesterase